MQEYSHFWHMREPLTSLAGGWTCKYRAVFTQDANHGPFSSGNDNRKDGENLFGRSALSAPAALAVAQLALL